MSEYDNGYIIDYKNSNYDRNKAKIYAEKYALNPNVSEYPYFKENDCVNFISQVLKYGGIKELGWSFDKIDSWFCHTKNVNNLKKISLTWRVSGYFRRYFGNENGFGENKAAVYTSITVKEAIENFDRLYTLLDIGDVVQYGRHDSKIPYHTQVIHDKGYNWQIKKYDLFMAQHTKNRLYISFYNYLSKLSNKHKKPVYLYKIKED